MYTLDSDAGYMIRVTPVYPSVGEWVYLAYGPNHKVEKVGDCLVFEGLEYKSKYELGEEVPPAYSYRTMLASRFLDGFHSKQHGGTDQALVAAKAACEQHRNQYGAL